MSDVHDLYELHSDSRSWVFLPERRYTTHQQVEKLISKSRRRFERDGLGYWAVFLKHDPKSFVGWGGCAKTPEMPWWNLTYRVNPEHWGKGFATEIGEQALAAAHEVAPDVPVIAYTMQDNTISQRVLEKLGLRMVWHGQDPANASRERVVYLDRAASKEHVNEITHRFSTMPRNS